MWMGMEWKRSHGNEMEWKSKYSSHTPVAQRAARLSTWLDRQWIIRRAKISDICLTGRQGRHCTQSDTETYRTSYSCRWTCEIIGGVASWLAAFVAWTKLTSIGPGQYFDRWPSLGGCRPTISACNQPIRSTQPCIPPMSLNRVSAMLG